MACVCGHAIEEHVDESGECEIEECECLGYEPDDDDEDEEV